MTEAENPHGLSLDSLLILLYNDRCPSCMTGHLDTGFECNSCGFDAMPLAQRLLRPQVPEGPEDKLSTGC